MKKTVSLTNILLLGLAGLVDLFEEARDPLGIQASYCQNIYGWVPERFRKHNFTRLVTRQINIGNLEKEIKNANTYLRLTPAGQEKVMADYPIFKLQNYQWDGKWRIVIFDIAEVSRRNRDILRAKLKGLGFGMLQKSVWVSPRNITQDFSKFINSCGLTEQVYIVESNRLLIGEEKIIAEKIWKLGELNEKYLKLFREIKELNTYITTHDREQLYTSRVENKQKHDTRQNKKSEVFKLKRKYLELLLTDPFLPKELLPRDWVGEEVKKEIKKI